MPPHAEPHQPPCHHWHGLPSLLVDETQVPQELSAEQRDMSASAWDTLKHSAAAEAGGEVVHGASAIMPHESRQEPTAHPQPRARHSEHDNAGSTPMQTDVSERTRKREERDRRRNNIDTRWGCIVNAFL